MLILAEEAPKNLQKSFAVYLFERSKLNEEVITQLLESLPLILKETVMSTAESFVEKGKRIGIEKGLIEGIEKGMEIGIEKGIVKGIEKGIEKGMKIGMKIGKADVIKNLLLNTDFNVSKIAMLTSVTEDFVVNIQSEISNIK